MSGAIACAVLLAAGVLLELAPAPLGRLPGRRRGRRRPSEAGGDRPRFDVATVMTEVAARLRGGAPVAAAWSAVLERHGVEAPRGGGVEGLAAAVRTAHGGPVRGARGARWRLRARAGQQGAPTDGLTAQLAALECAVRLADRLGAPLADVLDRCAGGVAEAGRAEAARAVALAGPAATARLLSWLPVVGVVLGLGLGVDPAQALLDGGAGTVSGVAGLVLLVAGRRWSRALVAGARRAALGRGS